jgi:hypothetical protein
VQYWRGFLRRRRTLMSVLPKLVLLATLFAAIWPHDARADRKTVCTITVNSPDEKDTFRRSLPQDEFQFVELVERGRPDWLASACRKGVHCDVLLISGHFDDGSEFYSDRLDARESLPVDEMERVSCSQSCPGLFSQLKEVYLFGCNTLNDGALHSASMEIARSLVRAGRSQADADRLAKLLSERHAESNRDRMRRIFKDVPVIYGFSAKAPLGPVAAALLDRYFQSGSAADVGSGRASPRLLGLFAPSSMTVASGLTDADPQAGYRQDVCRFADDRTSPAQKLGFVHALLERDTAEVRMFLDYLEKAVALHDRERLAPPVAQAFAEIARDQTARKRYLAFARDADEPAIRVRMIGLARTLGWLSPQEQRTELVELVGDLLSRGAVGPAEVELVCALNKDGELGPALTTLRLSAAKRGGAGNAAVLACLGDPEARMRVLQALTGSSDDDVAVAQVYLQHHPVTDTAEFRAIAARIARMKNADAQVRALDTLARLEVSDRESLDELTRLFPLAKSIRVQRAIAGVLIRADYRSIARPEFVRALRQQRLKSPDGRDLIDVLIHQLQDVMPKA